MNDSRLGVVLAIAAEMALLAGCTGCGPSFSWQETIIVYSALDREFAEPVLEDFSKATGVRVLAKYDNESTKTVGLTNLLIQEAGRPRCDVFWNNEILNTLRLEQRELLTGYDSPAGGAYPAIYRSPKGDWHGFAARARVLIVNTKLVAEGEWPKSIFDLADQKWKGKVGIARPVAGTTATHVACLFAALGEDKTKQYFRSLRVNEIQILGGNKQVAQACAAGQIAFGLTDTDDANIELERAAPVAIIYPDREPEQLGTLFIPNTLAILKGCPHGEQARRLIDYLLSPAVEEKLARGPSAQIPLNPAVTVPTRVETPQ
ncbi:MAG TPA: extracellular solute-binding protein, partial [Tepidisphaeraceae bacterium]|nr:extracellular solute-binding protein [Tepidisphaeraceae bacterium]